METLFKDDSYDAAAYLDNISRLFNEDEQEQIIDHLNSEIVPQLYRPNITVRGKLYPQRRDVGFFSDESQGYYYSGQMVKSIPLTDLLQDVLQKVNNFYGFQFNGILINFYRDGNDKIGAHSDDERYLDSKKSAVLSISFGAERIFRIRRKNSAAGQQKIDVHLKYGDILIMQGKDFQKMYTHEIPEQKKEGNPRISLTFRLHKI